MSAAIESLDARALELDHQLCGIIADAPLGHTIRLPQLGVTIEVVATEGDTVRVGIVATRDITIRRPEAKSSPPLPDYSGIPEIDMEEFARYAKDHPFTPTQEMLDEDWSDHTPKKDG